MACDKFGSSGTFACEDCIVCWKDLVVLSRSVALELVIDASEIRDVIKFIEECFAHAFCYFSFARDFYAFVSYL